MGERLMSQKEAQRYAVVQRLVASEMSQAQAALVLGISVRQVKRLCRRVREQGPAGLVSRKRGVPSNRRIAPLEREQFVALVRQHYADFGHQIQTLNGGASLTETQWREAKTSVKDMVLRGIGAI